MFKKTPLLSELPTAIAQDRVDGDPANQLNLFI